MIEEKCDKCKEKEATKSHQWLKLCEECKEKKEEHDKQKM